MSKRLSAAPSLKAHALALLARREYSRAELREKLISHARKLATLSSPVAAASAEGSGSAEAAAEAPIFQRSRDRFRDSEAGLAEVERLLDWLQEQRHQSDERFLEGRVRRRAPALGQARIRQELARHGLELAPELACELKASELERAHSLWLRRYGERANSVAERAKQARFLAARGFSVDTIARVVGGRED